MSRTKIVSRRIDNGIQVIQIGNLIAGNPLPGGSARAGFTSDGWAAEALADGRGDFRAQSRSGKIGCGHEEVLRKNFRVGFKRNNAAVECGQLGPDDGNKAIEAKRGFGPGRAALENSLSADIKRVRNEHGDPWLGLIEMDALRGRAGEPGPEIPGAPAKSQARICALQWDSLHGPCFRRRFYPNGLQNCWRSAAV